MINIPNAIIKDIASYVVIDTTSPLYKLKACVCMGGYHLVHDYSIKILYQTNVVRAIKYVTQNKGCTK